MMFQSLKKEIDWDRPNDDKVGGETSEYRMQHESVSITFYIDVCMYVEHNLK